MTTGDRVLVIGDVITDIIVRPEGPILPGTDRRAMIRPMPGGSGANQACWLAAEDVPVRLAARVGAADGSGLAAMLRAQGVEPALATDPDLPTGIIVTLLGPDGERSFLTDRGANTALGAADLPVGLLDGVGLVHVSGYALIEPGARAAVLGLVAAAGRRGIPWTVDPGSSGFLADVGVAAFLDWTRGAAICFPNADEAALLAGSTDPDRQGVLLGAAYACVVIKRGAAGAELVDAEGRLHRPAPAKVAVDSTGAGDAFLAAFLARRRAGAARADCLDAAVAAGSAAVGHLGGRPPPIGRPPAIGGTPRSGHRLQCMPQRSDRDGP